MKKTILALSAILFLNLFCASAQSVRFSFIPGETENGFRAVGCGHWNATGNDGGLFRKYHLSLNYLSPSFLVSTDFSLDGKKVSLENFHVNPALNIRLNVTSERGFRMQAFLYPVLGVTEIRNKDSHFDYGAAAGIGAAGKVGGLLLFRLTRHTISLGADICF